MKWIFTLTFLCWSLTLGSAMSAPAVAPANRLNIWQGAGAIPDTSFTSGSTTAMGIVKTLQSNLLVTYSLSPLDMNRAPGAYFSTTNFNGIPHQRLTDNGGSPGQCVAFARSMTGTKTSNYWEQGTSLGSYLNWTPSGYVLSPLSQIAPLPAGTMIAYFRGLANYPQNPIRKEDAGHVAIFLSWIYSGAYITGAYVVDQNLVDTVSIGGVIRSGADGLIQKHTLPVACPSGQVCTNIDWKWNLRYFASNYHVVNVRWSSCPSFSRVNTRGFLFFFWHSVELTQYIFNL